MQISSMQFFTMNMDLKMNYIDFYFKDDKELIYFINKLKISKKRAYDKNNTQPYLIMNSPHLLKDNKLKEIHMDPHICYNVFENLNLFYKYHETMGYWSKYFVEFIEQYITKQKIKHILNENKSCIV